MGEVGEYLAEPFAIGFAAGRDKGLRVAKVEATTLTS
jgi:hypothetical protein